mmetsp:Transcript_13888/g.19297  ORF Transcript_13888/g.19297 Transcript_13888/m.19297 type:complete len:202 (-) Transcript_13888:339-944(-)
MAHILVVKGNVVLGSHVVSNVVIHDQTEESIEKGQVHLFVDSFERSLHANNAFTVGGFPDALEIVDTLAPFVHQQGRWFTVARLDPVGEQLPFIGFVPQVLVKVGISNLLKRLHIVDRSYVAVKVHKFNTDFLESSLSKQVSLNSAEGFVWVIVGLLDETELFSLRGVESALDAVCFLESFQGQDKQLGVVLVVERREWNW